jgi:hypothetical protein
MEREMGETRSDRNFELWWVSNPSNMLNLTPEQAERAKITAKGAWEASRYFELLELEESAAPRTARGE